MLTVTRCALAGEPAALQQLAHDSVKRCMLGFKTASDVQSQEHFVCTGLMILSTVYHAAEVRSNHELKCHSCVSSTSLCLNHFSSIAMA